MKLFEIIGRDGIVRDLDAATRDEAIFELVAHLCDQGRIPEEEQDKLFKPFTKLSVKATGGEMSTGLGLAISRRIVEAHDGDIWVESEAGEGSTFYVRLPVDAG